MPVSSGRERHQPPCRGSHPVLLISFHLLIDWRAGESWFWDTLVDADEANNPEGWQWVAGSGADAAPYFRIFNPVLQGQKFDPQGDYVRHWLPELHRLPAASIHAPWQATPDQLAAASVRLGETYPLPIIAHHEARTRALSAFETMRGPRSQRRLRDRVART